MTFTHYVTLEVNTDSDLTPGFVLCQAVDQLRNNHGIRFAIAFPDAQEGASNGAAGRTPPSIGERCQLFGSEGDLQRVGEVLMRYRDYLFVSRVRPVPSGVKHAVYQREQNSRRTPARIEREIRRSLRRAAAGKFRPVTEDDMARWRAGTRSGSEPFLMAKSHSSQTTFALTFRRTIVDAPVAGTFDSFGFGKDGASVPYLP